MTFHALWSGYGVRKWSTVFTRWGFSTFSVELYGEDCVRWVNFGDTADVDDIPRFYAGTVDKNRSEFVGSGGAGRGAGGAGGALDEGDIVLPVVKLVPGVWYHLAVRHGAASGAAGRGGGWLSVPKLFVRDQLTVMVDSAVRLERELPVPHLKRDKHRLERPAVGRGCRYLLLQRGAAAGAAPPAPRRHLRARGRLPVAVAQRAGWAAPVRRRLHRRRRRRRPWAQAGGGRCPPT